MNRRGRNQNRGNQQRSGPSEPLVTEHIHDLDLELELLRRKRQLLQQQQDMLSSAHFNRGGNQYGYSADYSQPRNDYAQSRTSYQQPRPQLQQNSINFSDFYDERVTATHSTNSSSFGVKRRFQTDPYNPGAGPSQNKRARNKRSDPTDWGQSRQGQTQAGPSSSRPRFRTKSRPTGPPKPNANTPRASAPPATKPMTSTFSIKPRKRPAPRPHDEDIDTTLRPNEPLVPLVAGRLELALGQVMKEIRETHKFVPTSGLYRHMKQAVRERIHAALLGKKVGKTDEIMEIYRAKFPKSTDLEVISIVKDMHERSEGVRKPSKFSMEFIEADNPEQYFKANITKLLNIRIDEMFGKLQDLYKQNDGELKKIVETLPDLSKEENNKEEPSNGTKADESVNPNEAEKPKDEEEKMADASVEEVKTESTEQAVIPVEDDEDAIAKRLDQYDKLMDKMLKDKLPAILQKSKNQIMRLLNVDRMYKEFRVLIIQQASLVRRSEPSGNASVGVNVLPYYVRIVGKPALPPRSLMRDFIDKFNPKSIKKHKNISHMLFIGFSDKADFESILARDGEVIGSSTLHIKISDRTKQYKEAQIQEEVEKAQQVVKGETNVKCEEKTQDIIEIKDEEKTKTDVKEVKDEDKTRDVEMKVKEDENTNVNEIKDGNNKTKDTDLIIFEDHQDEADAEIVQDLGTQIDDLLTTVRNTEALQKAYENNEDEANNVESGMDTTETQANGDKNETTPGNNENKDDVIEVNDEKDEPPMTTETAPVKGTPTRASTRTRRASKLT